MHEMNGFEIYHKGESIPGLENVKFPPDGSSSQWGWKVETRSDGTRALVAASEDEYRRVREEFLASLPEHEAVSTAALSASASPCSSLQPSFLNPWKCGGGSCGSGYVCVLVKGAFYELWSCQCVPIPVLPPDPIWW